MVLEVIGIMLAVIILSIIINGVEDYCKQSKRVNMSFKEAMDLVELPVVTFYNGDKKFNFLLDTGATISVINSNILNNFPHEKVEATGVLWGMEGNKIDVSYVRASLVYKDKVYEEEFQVVDMAASFNEVKAESGVTLSGILGNSFFKKYQYVLDFNSLIAYSSK